MEKPEIQCIICKEPITKGAKKCIRCSSFQDWRRHISISVSVIGLIVAFSSLIGGFAALKFSFPSIFPTVENVSIGWSSTKPGDMQIWVVNQGNGAAMLQREVSVNLIKNSVVQGFYAMVNPGTSRDITSLIIEPNSKTLFYLTIRDKKNFKYEFMVKGAYFYADVTVVDITSQKERSVNLSKVKYENN